MLYLDPGCGEGALVEVLREHGYLATGFDLIDRGRGYPVRDALDPEPWPSCGAVIMNPPFSLAAQFVRRALDECTEVIALLRLNWLEPAASRRDLLELQPDVLVLATRPRFRSDRSGSDSQTCAWLRWPGKGHWRLANKEV